MANCLVVLCGVFLLVQSISTASLQVDENRDERLDLFPNIARIAAKVAKTAKAFPDISSRFHVPRTKDLSMFEQFTKSKVIQELLYSLMETWARINIQFMKGLRILSDLNDKAQYLVEKLEEKGIHRDVLQRESFEKIVRRRITELMNEAAGIPNHEEDFEEYKLQFSYATVKRSLVSLLSQRSLSDETNMNSMYNRLWLIEFINQTMEDIFAPLEELKHQTNEKIAEYLKRSEKMFEQMIAKILEADNLWMSLEK